MKIRLFLLLLISLPAWTQTGTIAKVPPTSALEGQVVKDPGSLPVKKAEVQLIAEGQEEEGKTYTGTTDAEGHFRIEGIRAGRYRAFVERVGLVEIDKRRKRSAGTALSFDPRKDISDLVLHMLPAAVVVGRVVDEDGDPMPRADVSVLRYGYTLGQRHLETAASGTTNDLGEYRIPDLLPGRYLITANPTPDFSNLAAAPADKPNGQPKQETAYVPTYYPGTTDRSEAAFLELRAGDETAVNFNLTPSQTFHVRGSVANLGNKNGRAALSLRAKDSNTEIAELVDKDGKFDLDHVPPGSYTLLARTENLQSAEMTQQLLEVANSDVNGLRVVLMEGSRVRGKVSVAGNRKADLSSLLIFLQPGDRDRTQSFFDRDLVVNPTLAQVKSDGAFELKDVPAGNYVVRIEGDPKLEDFYLKSTTVGPTDITNSGLTVGGGGTYSLEVLVGMSAAKLDGTVVDSDGHPVADATVVVVPSGERSGRSELYQKGNTDQRGVFYLAGLTPGDYVVYAFESIEEGAYLDPAFMKPHENSGEKVHLDENSRKTLRPKIIPAGEDEP
jgi:protocatechuate 3,4-dioxygenase beta subunit